VPKEIPRIKVRAKYFKVAPPKKKIAKRTNKTVREVFKERVKV